MAPPTSSKMMSVRAHCIRLQGCPLVSSSWNAFRATCNEAISQPERAIDSAFRPPVILQEENSKVSWGMLYFNMVELINLFKAISLIEPGDMGGLRMAPHHSRC